MSKATDSPVKGGAKMTFAIGNTEVTADFKRNNFDIVGDENLIKEQKKKKMVTSSTDDPFRSLALREQGSGVRAGGEDRSGGRFSGEIK